MGMLGDHDEVANLRIAIDLAKDPRLSFYLLCQILKAPCA